MEVKQWVNLILKRFWLILLLPVLSFTMAAYVSFYVLIPVYESDITLYVISGNNSQGQGSTYSDSIVSPQLIKDYSEIIKSRTVTQAVIDKLGLKAVTPEELGANINISLKSDTNIIEIKAKSQIPANAKRIVDEFGNIFIQKIGEMAEIKNVYIVDKAEVPDSPVSPDPLKNIAAAFFIGLFAALGITFFLEYLDDTIRTPEEVEEQLGLTVMGIIPDFDIR